jgi:hypothetical protein
MAGTNVLSGSAKGKELLESLSDYQYQLKDSMELDMILRVELSILVQCLRGGLAMSLYLVLVFVDCNATERC